MTLVRMAIANLKKSFKDYSLYFVTAILCFGIFYAFNAIGSITSALNISETNQTIFSLVEQFTGTLSIFISLFILFLIIYSERFLFKRRSKEFGLYLILGMQKKHLAAIIAVEQICTLLVSCIVGFVIGQVFSQVLLQVASLLFRAPASMSFVIFSPSSLMTTLGLFALAFLVSLVLNVGYIWSQPIIKLLKAKRFVQRNILTKPWILFVLFIISLIGIAASYALLSESGVDPNKPGFTAATLLVVVSTAVFFFSSLSALIVICKAIPNLYYKGIRSFTLRQLSSQINSHFLSLTAITCALFLAISSTGMGVSLMNAINGALAINDAWDVSFEMNALSALGDESTSPDEAAQMAKQQELAFDKLPQELKTRLEKESFDFDKDFSDMVELSLYSIDNMNMVDLSHALNDAFTSKLDQVTPEFASREQVSFVSRSEVDKFLRASKLPELKEPQNEVILFAESQKEADGFSKEINSSQKEIVLEGKTYPLSHKIAVIPLSFVSNMSFVPDVIVPDALLDGKGIKTTTYLNARYSSPEVEKSYEKLLAQSFTEPSKMEQLFADDGFYVGGITKQMLLDMTFGINAAIGFLALYIAVILIVVTGAILSLQQLTQTIASLGRYQALSELGASNKQIYGNVVKESLVLYLLPLFLAAAHSACVFAVINKSIQDAGSDLDIYSGMDLFTAGFFALFVVYWLLCTSNSLVLVKKSLSEARTTKAL